MSILLTLVLPVLSVCGTVLAVNLHKKINNFITLSTVLYGMAFILLMIVIIFINKNAIVLTIGCFGIISCLMAGVNNIITSMVPLEMKNRVNSGKLAGILNGFCYVGSTISAFGLGVIADNFDWMAVFVTLLVVLIIITCIGYIYICFTRRNIKINS